MFYVAYVKEKEHFLLLGNKRTVIRTLLLMAVVSILSTTFIVSETSYWDLMHYNCPELLDLFEAITFHTNVSHHFTTYGLWFPWFSALSFSLQGPWWCNLVQSNLISVEKPFQSRISWDGGCSEDDSHIIFIKQMKWLILDNGCYLFEKVSDQLVHCRLQSRFNA